MEKNYPRGDARGSIWGQAEQTGRQSLTIPTFLVRPLSSLTHSKATQRVLGHHSLFPTLLRLLYYCIRTE